jgi:predicted DNA-binding protein
MPTRLKKRYSILLSDEIAERFERVARRRNGAKSAIIEEMLDRRLNPERYPLIDDGILRRLDEMSRNLAGIKSDVAVATEMVSLFVRYYLTITPPLATSEQTAARALGKERFQVFVAQIGRRIASDRRLVSEVMESIVRNDPDLFALPPDEEHQQVPPAGAAENSPPQQHPNGKHSVSSESENHGG